MCIRIRIRMYVARPIQHCPGRFALVNADIVRRCAAVATDGGSHSNRESLEVHLAANVLRPLYIHTKAILCLVGRRLGLELGLGGACER